MVDRKQSHVMTLGYCHGVVTKENHVKIYTNSNLVFVAQDMIVDNSIFSS